MDMIMENNGNKITMLLSYLIGEILTISGWRLMSCRWGVVELDE
jgi:hypothetical protein